MLLLRNLTVMHEPPIAAVMIHISDVAEALDWYERAFEGAIRSRAGDPEFEFLALGDVQLEFVPADAKVSSGACGSVVYWQVPQFEIALQHFLSVGAVLHRGPMQIEDNQCMCQIKDPWGNCIGLRGPAHPSRGPQKHAGPA